MLKILRKSIIFIVLKNDQNQKKNVDAISDLNTLTEWIVALNLGSRRYGRGLVVF